MLVMNLEGDFTRDVRPQVVINDRSVRRVLSGGSICRERSVWPGVPTHSQRRFRRKEKDLGFVRFCIKFSQGRKIIQHPQPAAVSSGNQIIAMNLKIANGDSGQVQLQWLPMIAAVKRYMRTRFCARVN